MYTLPILFALPILLAAQDIQPLTIQLPPCIIPCLQTVFFNACGSTNDWACACNSNQVSFLNDGCAVAVYDCTSTEIIDAQGLLDQICMLETQAHGSSSATLGSNSGSVSATSTPAPSQISTPTSTTPSQINVLATTGPIATPTATNTASKSMASRALGASQLRSVLKAACLVISAAWLLAGSTLV